MGIHHGLCVTDPPSVAKQAKKAAQEIAWAREVLEYYDSQRLIIAQ